MSVRNLKWLFLLAAAVLAAACEKDDEKQEPVKPKYEVLGVYEQGGRSFDILQAVGVLENGYYSFMFSPDAPVAGAKISSYCVLEIKAQLAGSEFLADSYYHNDDYKFVFEDPKYYYSVFKKLTGTILVVPGKDNRYQVKMNVKLADGSDFKLDFDNVVSSQDEE